jgi:hypothetical protein
MNLFKWYLCNYPIMSLFSNNNTVFKVVLTITFWIIIYEPNMHSFLNMDEISIFFYCKFSILFFLKFVIVIF